VTPLEAGVLRTANTYCALGYGLSEHEVQKLAYFLQEAGEALNLPFEKHAYGPYSDTLRHVLNRMEGHFIRGLGDGVVDAEIEPVTEALAEAETFVEAHGYEAMAERVQRVGDLIEGFQSPYGMELLATVHWVAKHEGAATKEQAIAAVRAWNERKKSLMTPEHVAAAWNRLEQAGWLRH
jgi:hypothetical protein